MINQLYRDHSLQDLKHCSVGWNISQGNVTKLVFRFLAHCVYHTQFNLTYNLINNIIQIKICAEYRDMLPRPKLVCQEPGLRPIGRSPGVSDKSSRGLGSMSRYSAQILICFIAYIFQFFCSSVGLVGNFAGLPVNTVPSAVVHCYQNEAGHQTIKAPSMPCWGAAGPSKHSLASMPQTGEIGR